MSAAKARRRRGGGGAGVPPPTAERRPVSWRAPWIGLALIAVTLAAYAPAARHDFVAYDDSEYVTQNPQVAAGLTWQGIVWAFTTGHAANWHPLTWLSHMLDVELFGMRAGGHHVVNVLLHTASTVLLFVVLTRMTGHSGRSAVVAALFGLHPLHVESVAWVAERKDVLSTLFWMLTLWAYAAYVRRRELWRYLLVVGLFALGLMAKPMLVTLPFVLLLLDFWPLGRMSGRGAEGAPQRPIEPRTALRLVGEKVPLLALTVASSVVTFIVQLQGGAVHRVGTLPLEHRLMNALWSYVAYIGQMVWPTNMAVIYPFRYPLASWQVVVSALTLVAVTAAAVRLVRRAPYVPVGWFWYLGTLVPVIGLIQVGSQPRADRYTYVPLIGLFVVVVWGTADLLARWSYRHIALPVGSALVVAVCAVLTNVQVRHWKDTVTLWTHATKVTRDNFMAHSHLGLALVAKGKLDEAVVQQTEVLRIRPGFAESHNNLGYTLARQGKLDEAMVQYAEAIKKWPDFPEAHNNLGLALAARGRLDEAIREFRETVRIKPHDAEAHFNLAVVLARKGQTDEAARHFAEAVRANPADPEAHYRLGLLLAEQGQVDRAVRHFETALQLNPRSQKVRRALGDLHDARRAASGTR